MKVAWEKPCLGSRSYKVNNDASLFNDSSGATVVVVRNCRGEEVAGVAEPFVYADNTAPIEALAIRRGLQITHQIGCSKVIC